MENMMMLHTVTEQHKEYDDAKLLYEENSM